MNSPVGRSYPKRGQRTVTSYSSSRRQRRSAGVPSRNPIVDQSGAAAQKWARVLRNPVSLLDEPYFGSSPSASFKVPVWVKISDLTEDEKLKYEEGEKEKNENRLAWKNEMEQRRASEAEATDDKEKEEETNNEDDEETSNNDDELSNQGDELTGEEVVDISQLAEATTTHETPVEAEARAQILVDKSTDIDPEKELEEAVALNPTSEEPIEPMQFELNDSKPSESIANETSQLNENDDLKDERCETNDVEEYDTEPLQKKQKLIDDTDA